MWHRHNWGIVGAQDLVEGLRGSDKTRIITVVLYRCAECGDVKTKDLRGHWTGSLQPPLVAGPSV